MYITKYPDNYLMAIKKMHYSQSHWWDKWLEGLEWLEGGVYV